MNIVTAGIAAFVAFVFICWLTTFFFVFHWWTPLVVLVVILAALVLLAIFSVETDPGNPFQ